MFETGGRLHDWGTHNDLLVDLDANCVIGSLACLKVLVTGFLQDALWQEHGHKTLPVLLGATDMLVCGEDLGMIPKCVHPTMQEMGIIGGQPTQTVPCLSIPLTWGWIAATSCTGC
jgi:hypothetical protein